MSVHSEDKSLETRGVFVKNLYQEFMYCTTCINVYDSCLIDNQEQYNQ